VSANRTPAEQHPTYQLDLLRREDGQTMTEYGILLALIVVGVVAVLVLLGPKIIAAYSFVNSSL
jgi:pilus assembly protein Flp/PilA